MIFKFSILWNSLSGPCWAQDKKIPEASVAALQKRLQFIFSDEELKNTKVGVFVYSLTRDEVLYSQNPDTALSPASAIKLLTAAAALKRLGPEYYFTTEVFADTKVQNGIIKGPVYLRGGGDPSLVTEQMYLLVNRVLRAEVSQITGEIIVDASVFEDIDNPERLQTNTDRAYNAQVSGLNFNYNTLTMFFRPSDKVGDKTRVYPELDLGYVKVVNQSTTSKSGSPYALNASRIGGKGFDTIMVKGSMPLGMSEQTSYFSVTDPAIYTGSAFQYMLQQRGVKLNSDIVRAGKVPPTAIKIAEHRSIPMHDIVLLMNKFSNNFIADALVITLGREIKGAPGSMSKGIEVLREEATRIGMNTSGFTLVSGSGLTRANRATPRQFNQLLKFSYENFDILPEMLSSLPVAGKDGTLRSRMRGNPATGFLRGKTGTINGVSSLVGLVQSQGGELIAFSVIMNDDGKAGTLRPWQNFFGQALAEFQRGEKKNE